MDDRERLVLQWAVRAGFVSPPVALRAVEHGGDVLDELEPSLASDRRSLFRGLIAEVLQAHGGDATAALRALLDPKDPLDSSSPWGGDLGKTGISYSPFADAEERTRADEKTQVTPAPHLFDEDDPTRTDPRR